MADVELQQSPPPRSPDLEHADAPQDDSADDQSETESVAPSHTNDHEDTYEKPLPAPPAGSDDGDPRDENQAHTHDDSAASHTSAHDPQARDPHDTPTVTVESPENDGTPSSAAATTTAPSGAVSTASRDRTSSQSTAATTDTARSSTKTSLVFVVAALETILASKDCQRNKPMKDATELALNTIKSVNDPTQIDPRLLFAPLRIATEEASNDNVVVAALDCLGKLISYSYFSVPIQNDGQEQAVPPESLIDQAIDAICNCFEGDATPDRIQLQIIISLLAAVLNDKVVVHGAGLLKAVRQMYNIFLFSKNPRTQQVAQGTLTQMVGTVFERASSRISAREARLNSAKTPTFGRNLSGSFEKINGAGGATQSSKASFEQNGESGTPDETQAVPVEKDGRHKITLKSFERRGSFDESLAEGPTLVTRVGEASGRRIRTASEEDEEGRADDDIEEEEADSVFLKDAFLVFRAMCKISIKPLPAQEIADPRSQGMRAKLLSLHIIHTVIFNNVPLFLSPNALVKGSSRDSDATTFIQAIKQPLCQALSRNGASSANRVFETGSEIFFVMIKHLRVVLKKEIEVFLKEIYLAILDNRNAPAFQKQCFLNVLHRLATDPRALVEVYLNYDCDRTASDNMFQRIVEHLARISSTPVPLTTIQAQTYMEKAAKKQALQDWQIRGILPANLTVPPTGSLADHDPAYPIEFAMKVQSLECVVETLRSLVHWAQKAFDPATPAALPGDSEMKFSTDDVRDSIEVRSPYMPGSDSAVSTPLAEDDPLQLEKAKQRKNALLDAIRQFNFKPKRGLKTLINSGFVKSSSPEDIAEFIMNTPQLNKAAIGEFLGEGEPENIAIMHAFVDSMDFTRTRFVDALRRFLQSFRLPGEAQKIDRFMLKFAERYILGNPNAYANADTAYVLAYSVIMLNTDQHSVKLKGKARMTPEDFIKNNRGINDSKDLPDDYLKGIYDEIATNEIVLNTERETAANLGYSAQPAPTTLTAAFANVGRDLQREAYMQRAEEMANRTEQLFKSLMRAQRKTAANDEAPVKFIPATSFKHIGPMFDVTWMPFLTALSGCAQSTNNMDTVRLCMDGMKLAIQIACLFDLENPRQAFVSYLARFTNLYNLSEMQGKNVEALRVLLDVAYSEGNSLKESWREILTVISQLDRFQLISEGVDEKSLPDVLRAQPRGGRGGQRAGQRGQTGGAPGQTNYRADIAEEARGSEIVNGVDRIFTSTSRLSGEAIVDFVKALTQVSWQEIESSGQSEDPRTFSLQKLVEVSEYNMDRVRFEWTAIWQVLGEHFNQVGINANTKVVHFVLNSLRQLAVRFLDLEELPGFKFQKDFLKPFEHIMANSSSVQVKEIVLHSLAQMLQARGGNIRSGWRTIFGVFSTAAKESHEVVVNLAFENVLQIYEQRFGTIIIHGALTDLMVCLTAFSKNTKFQKRSLQAIEILKTSIPKMLKTPECPLSSQSPTSTTRQPSKQSQEEQFWWPVLFSFHDVIMTGEDLEVRSRALNYLFDALTKYGHQFPRDFWDIIWRQLLYTIFMVLKSKSELTKMVNHEELAVWLSTTMIQALRNIMSLFTHYFDALEYMLDRCLNLLALCICQENDTLARIGSNCLQSLIMSNVEKFSTDHWAQIVDCFVELFNNTEASALFSAAASYSSSSLPPSAANGADSLGPRKPSFASTASGNELKLTDEHSTERRPSTGSGSRLPSPMGNGRNGEASSPLTSPTSTPVLEDYGRPDSAAVQAQPPVVTAARRRFFNKIITQCVLQLLMIETVNELFSNDRVYTQIPSNQLLRLMALLKKSYHFAKRFNDDLDLRNRLFAEGFMKQPPNLLKQESGSASVYVNILFRMYHDTGEERIASRSQTEAALIPLCTDIMDSFAALNADTQQRNIITWRPVVIDVIDGYTNFPTEGFAKHVAEFAPIVPRLMGREMGHELQRSVQVLVQRILELHYEMPSLDGWLMGAPAGPATPTSAITPTASGAQGVNVFGRRRASRASSFAPS